jgi:peptidoglycan hydrolase-like protein with peptidoglycan-binding domain
MARGNGWVSRHRRVAIVTAAAAVVTTAGVVAAVAVTSAPQDAPQRTGPPVTSVKIASGSLVEETSVPGTVQHATQTPVVAGLTGVVTQLPPPGEAIAAGDVLYRVDTRPVVLLKGDEPVWRDLKTGMSDGADVEQLERNLGSLGWFAGLPDEHFGSDTAAAVMSWQRSLELERTGAVEAATIVFSDHARRVDAVATREGAQIAAGATVYEATGTRKIVALDVKSSDRALAVKGTDVAIVLPDGSRVDGVVGTIGSPIARESTDGAPTSVVVPVRVKIKDQSAVKDLALATVQVQFASTLRDDALTVPVDALVPIDEARFAVEVAEPGADGQRRLVPVTVGAFASGVVEISGAGVTEGLDVVVPAS